MTLWFYILFFIVVSRVLFSPISDVLRKTLGGVTVLIVLWLGVGIIVYGVKTYQFTQLEKETKSQRDSLQITRDTFEILEKDHPTARDVLLQLASLSYQLGDTDRFSVYLRKAKDGDPNNTIVKKMSEFVEKQ